MTKTLYIGNLPCSASEDGLAQRFREFGAVESVRIVLNPLTRVSRGFAFVEMSSESGAKAVIDNLGSQLYHCLPMLIRTAATLESIKDRLGVQGPTQPGKFEPRFSVWPSSCRP